MNRNRSSAVLLLALAGLAPFAASAAPNAAALPYPSASRIDLTAILAPPPDAAATRQELEALLAIQKRRNAADEAACVADQVISVYVFADVLGPKFTAAALPKTDALFQRVLATVHVPMAKAQQTWARKRPPLADPAIHPVGSLPPTAAYPSGHATSGALMGILLAGLLPERSAELHARGVLFGYRRILAGVHYPSDVEAGRQSAAAIAQSLYQDPQFMADYGAARTELRAGLGLAGAAKDGDGDGDAMPKGGEASEY